MFLLLVYLRLSDADVTQVKREIFVDRFFRKTNVRLKWSHFPFTLYPYSPPLSRHDIVTGSLIHFFRFSSFFPLLQLPCFLAKIIVFSVVWPGILARKYLLPMKNLRKPKKNDSCVMCRGMLKSKNSLFI